jgi:hypothetical protein
MINIASNIVKFVGFRTDNETKQKDNKRSSRLSRESEEFVIYMLRIKIKQLLFTVIISKKLKIINSSKTFQLL